MERKIIDYTLNRIAEASVNQSPFPHSEISNFFQPDYYQRMLRNWPTSDLYDQAAENALRMDLVVDPAGGGDWSISKYIKDPAVLWFWQSFSDWFFSEEISLAFFKLFDIKQTDDFFSCGRICIDKKDSGIGPHRDRFDKIVSLVFYAGDEATKHVPGMGTQLFTPKPGIVLTDEHYRFDECDFVREAEYDINKMFAFKRGDESLHAYHQTDERERKAIKSFIQKRIDPELIREEVMKTKEKSRRWREEKGV